MAEPFLDFIGAAVLIYIKEGKTNAAEEIRNELLRKDRDIICAKYYADSIVEAIKHLSGEPGALSSVAKVNEEKRRLKEICLKKGAKKFKIGIKKFSIVLSKQDI